MKELIGFFMMLAAIIVLWLNPSMLNGLINTVKDPVQAWVENPDKASSEHRPWMIDPDKIKKGAGKTGDKILDAPDSGENQKTKDPGLSINADKDAGEGQKTKDLGESQNTLRITEYKGSNDPGDKWKIGPDPGRAYAVVESNNKQSKSSKKPSKDSKSSYTKFEFDAYAVAVQKAK